MKTALLVLFGLVASHRALAESSMTCEYSYYGAPMATIVLFYDEAGALRDLAKITMNGASTHWESVTAVTAAPGEIFHAWFSKDTQNEIEMILYAQPQKLGRSKIVNHQMPMAKEIWGDCKN